MLTMALAACSPSASVETDGISRTTEFSDSSRQFTPEVMWGMGKMGEATVSPDGSKIAYTVTYYDLDKNKGNAELYVMNADGTDCKQVTQSAKSEFNPVWLTDSQLAFARGTDNGAQIFAIGIEECVCACIIISEKRNRTSELEVIDDVYISHPWLL